jgi:hypothetical protein
MGTRRRHRKHRGGVPFIPDKTAIGPAGQEREKKRYEAWLANRKIEAVEDSALEKIKRERLDELSGLASTSPVKARIHEEQEKISEKDIESTRAADEETRRLECKAHLRSHIPPLKSRSAAKEWLDNKDNRRANPQDYAEVRDCVRILGAAGAGRKTRRRKTRRRR